LKKEQTDLVWGRTVQWKNRIALRTGVSIPAAHWMLSLWSARESSGPW